MNKPEILVIDDHIDTANTYSDLIETSCNINAISTSNPEEAINFVSNYPIKIIVIDQIMPKLGTDLFRNLKDINPHLKAIMVSGESSLKYVEKAKALGYSDFLHKTDIDQIPEYIFKLYAEYELDLMNNRTYRENKILLIEKSRNPFKLCKTTYRLIDYKITNEAFVFDDSWITKRKIERGENTKIEISFSVSEKLIISEEVNNQLKTSFSMSDKLIKNLKMNLENTLSTKWKRTNEQSTSQTYTKSIELSLNDDKIDDKLVMSRNYETAQVFMQVSVQIKKSCTCCGEQKIIPLITYKPINKLAFRQINYIEGKQQIIDTGYLNFE